MTEKQTVCPSGRKAESVLCPRQNWPRRKYQGIYTKHKATELTSEFNVVTVSTDKKTRGFFFFILAVVIRKQNSTVSFITAQTSDILRYESRKYGHISEVKNYETLIKTNKRNPEIGGIYHICIFFACQLFPEAPNSHACPSTSNKDT